MSDLLTRLAQRALGTAAPAVHPRLPSRFADAPGDIAPSLFREESEEVEALAPRISPRPAPAAAHPSPDRVLPREPDAGGTREPGGVARRETGAVRSGEQDSVLRREADAVQPPRVVADSRGPAEPPPARPVMPAAGIEEVVERVVDGHRPDGAPSTESRSAAPAAPRVDADQPRRPASPAPPARPAAKAGEAREDGFHPVHVMVEAGDDDEPLMPRSPGRARSVAKRGEDEGSPPATRAARPRREADGGIVEVAETAEPRAQHTERDAGGAQPRASRGSVVRPDAVRVAERPAAHLAEEPRDERPVVRVTIGRIEVRAAPPPAQPQPAAKPGWKPPVLSLDEYLQREARR